MPSRLPSLARRLSPWILGALMLAANPLRAATDDTDAKTIEEMRQRLVAVQKQILASKDIGEQARLQKSLTGIMEETLPKLSAQARTPMLVSLRLVQPLQQAGGEYVQMIADFSASTQSDFSTIKSREDIQDRLKQIDRLATFNQGLID
ncbi:MAG: hypothetical protein ABUL68_03380, partial [Pseudomonadota bacterium]